MTKTTRIPKTTEVHNVNDFNEIQTFSLPPERAVVAADRQSQGDFNTWEYDKYRAKKGEFGWVSGDFWAKDDRIILATH